ncbi:MAG: YitT family protein [Bacteroidota bacterium]
MEIQKTDTISTGETQLNKNIFNNNEFVRKSKAPAAKFAKNAFQTLFMICGVLSAGFGLEGFLVPNHFIDGGVTGISMLVSSLSGIDLSILIAVFNIPFIAVAWFQIGKEFAIKGTLLIIGLSLALIFVHYPEITHDKLLAAVFGGFFLGAGIGLAIRGGGVLDGTEITAVIVSRKLGLSIGDVILVFNILIFAVAAIYLGIEVAMYSILTYLSASKTVDFLIHGIEEYNGVWITSQKSEEIKQMIYDQMHRGVTVYNGQGGLTNAHQAILFCVVTRLEIPRIKQIIREVDKRAFIVINPVSDASGGVLKKQVLDH